jgi:hypothetical protein
MVSFSAWVSTGTRQVLAIEPDRLGLGHRIVQCQPDKPRNKKSRTFT